MIRKKLTDFQLTALTELEKEVALCKDQFEKAQQKLQLGVNLVLDAHGVLGQKVSFDQETKELLIGEPETI
jgi:hypothetical protein